MLRLRALEPEDIDYIYALENDPSTWHSGSLLAPISRHTLSQMVHSSVNIAESSQLRFLVCEHPSGTPVGVFDLFNIDFLNRNASVGLIVYPAENRNRGFAREALTLLEHYAFSHVHLHQLYAEVLAENIPSLKLFLGGDYRVIGTKQEWLRMAEAGYKDVVCLQKINT